MNITVAGAGAGKTTSMAKVILDRLREIEKGKIIYVVTFTNAARDRIREKVIEENGSIPKQICIETYHSFLIREFIFPFHHLIYGNQYIQATQITLSDNHAYKAKKIKELEAGGQIHVEKVTEIAKWIICGKSNDKKIHKEKRKKILSIIYNYLDAVFVDEAQDIDEHLSKIIETLHLLNLHITLVGDPKQDLRGRDTFRELIQKYSEQTVFMEENHRCPISHINLANEFVDIKERQIAQTDQPGELSYIYESDVVIEVYVIENQYWDHVYILKKNDRFFTNISDVKVTLGDLTYELKNIMKKEICNEGRALDLISYRAQQLCLENIDLNNFLISKKLEESFKIKLSKNEMARLAEALNRNRQMGVLSGVKVNSIDSVKGLEGNKCMFIVTTDIAPYLLGEKTMANKMKNYLYVALTRAREELMLLITKEVEVKYGREILKKRFDEMKIDFITEQR